MSKVYISPSTQENNVSVLKDYGTEERVMHLIADEVVSLLKDNGIETYRGRKEQTLANLVSESNMLNVDCHVAIHSNAMGADQSGKARGCEVWIYKGSTKGRKLAEAIYKNIADITPTSDRGVKETTGLYEVKNTKATACIIEIAFHDNVEDAKWILSNINQIAEAIVSGICEYLGISDKSELQKLKEENMMLREKLIKIKSIIGV